MFGEFGVFGFSGTLSHTGGNAVFCGEASTQTFLWVAYPLVKNLGLVKVFLVCREIRDDLRNNTLGWAVGLREAVSVLGYSGIL